MFIPRPARLIRLLLLLLLPAATAVLSAAEPDQRPFSFSRQPLEQALEQFAEQTRRQVSVDADLIQGLESPEVTGTMTPDAALAALVAGTGLEIVRVNGTAFALRADPNTPAPAATRERIEEVIAIGHYREYDATRANAFQLGLDLVRTPASVSVISQDILQDLQVNNVDEALRNVAGVTRFKTGNGGEERFTIRGFDASGSIFKDGARSSLGLNVSNIPSTETGNIERIEVLKGPSALLYGEGAPGGVINYITKRPEANRSTTIEVLGGSFDFYKVEVDTTGAFADDSPFAYRVVATYEDSKSFRDEISRERLLVNPTVSWTGDRGTVVAGIEYIDDDYTQDRGQVLDGDLFGGYRYSSRQDIEQFYGIPGFNDQSNAESTRLYVRTEYDLLDNWRIEGTISNIENDKQLFDTNASAVSATFGFIGAEGSPLDNFARITANSADSTGETTQYTVKNFFDINGPGEIEHQILASLTYEEFETDGRGRASTDAVFYNVVTGTYAVNNPAAPTSNPASLLTFFDTGFGVRQDFNETGLNVLDYVTLNEHWALLFGFRYSEYEDKLTDFDDDDLSFRGGIVYSFNDNFSAYLSYAEGYTSSQGRLDENDSVIDPATSTAWELGVKWQPNGESLLLTGTLYSVVEEDVAFLANPFAPAAQQRFGNIGEYETQGIEIEVVGRITDRWRVQAGYSFIDNEVIEGGTAFAFGPLLFGFDEGNTFGGIAEHNANLTSFYELSLAGGLLGLGGSIYYQGDSFASAENRAEYTGFTEIGLTTYFRKGGWKFQLNVNNLTDEEYLLTQTGVTPDAFAAFRLGTSRPRTVFASVALEF
ncbi:MAG: TonB-dependent receptor [Pseudomonadota bacterium]